MIQQSYSWASIQRKQGMEKTCTPVFIAALYTMAKTWKQPKRPSTEEWIKKMRYIFTIEYYSDIKKNAMIPFAATWMDLEIIILSMPDIERQLSSKTTYVEPKKWYKWTSL